MTLLHRVSDFQEHGNTFFASSFNTTRDVFIVTIIGMIVRNCKYWYTRVMLYFILLKPTGYVIHQQFNLLKPTSYVMYQHLNLLKPTGHVMHQQFNL